ncbi:PIN domain-containing protein [Candidatus Woesearchaeota archaeon]|nr:PIN domain-containing protein [Candidatus Woesearchaeota archaeon]
MSELNAYSLLDANILVHAFDNSDEFKHEMANELFESALYGEMRLAVTTQVLSETFNVFTRHKYFKNRVNLEEIRLFIADIVDISEIPKLSSTPKTILSAMELHITFGVEFYDAVIAATMKEHGITTIYTEDKDFDKIEGIKAVNPFEKRA